MNSAANKRENHVHNLGRLSISYTKRFNESNEFQYCIVFEKTKDTDEGKYNQLEICSREKSD